MKKTKKAHPVWVDKNGDTIACREKIKVMSENMDEFLRDAQDIFEDALLMGCKEKQVKDFMTELIASLHNPYTHDDGAK